MKQQTLTDSIQSINKSLDHIIQTVKGLSEETIRWNPTEEEWSIMQIVCHVLEASPYWLNEIQHILESPGTEWGRGLQNEERLAAVAVSNTEQRSVESVLKELEALKKQIEQKLGSLDQEKLSIESPSRNPRFGMKPISFIVDHLLVEHVSKHDGQIQRNVSKLHK